MSNKYHPRKQGYGEIYFIKVGNYYKIGATRDLYKRFHSIQVCNPEKCSIVHSIKTNDMKLTERLFHYQFERKKLQGEWYQLTDADIAYIKSGQYSKAITKSIGPIDDCRNNIEAVGQLLAI